MKPIIPFIAAAALSLATASAVHAQFAPEPVHPQAQPPHFDQVDADNNGQISRDEAAAAGLDFNWEEIDNDGTGYLTREEYDSAVNIDGADADRFNQPGGSGSDPGMDSLGADPAQPDIR